ncbi:uncharacterized protein SOCEGT47_049130 [Sorangium cellulosum]|uniref:Uncharacterized protein n=1 Tax=Sorangium cellulosum TaxID=56 RepID=A0A4P2Q5M3_SORCE|nr:uncharacterized protein SOCEGT47_049130 [Sorangium cellulosum]
MAFGVGCNCRVAAPRGAAARHCSLNTGLLHLGGTMRPVMAWLIGLWVAVTDAMPAPRPRTAPYQEPISFESGTRAGRPKRRAASCSESPEASALYALAPSS